MNPSVNRNVLNPPLGPKHYAYVCVRIKLGLQLCFYILYSQQERGQHRSFMLKVLWEHKEGNLAFCLIELGKTLKRGGSSSEDLRS